MALTQPKIRPPENRIKRDRREGGREGGRDRESEVKRKIEGVSERQREVNLHTHRTSPEE
jgi:hypothetical protein